MGLDATQPVCSATATSQNSEISFEASFDLLAHQSRRLRVSLCRPRARNRFNQVVEAKRFEGVFLCRKCAEFKNQTITKIGWYTKVLCATEYPRAMQYLRIVLKWGHPCMVII